MDKNQDKKYGDITKECNSVINEAEDPDNYLLTFPGRWPLEHKALFLGVVLFIDYAQFATGGGGVSVSIGD